MIIINKSEYNYSLINIDNEKWFFCLILKTLSLLYIIVLESVTIKVILMINVDKNI